MPSELTHLEGDEVSMVPRPANRRRFLLRKEDDMDDVRAIELLNGLDAAGMGDLIDRLAKGDDAEMADRLDEVDGLSERERRKILAAARILGPRMAKKYLKTAALTDEEEEPDTGEGTDTEDDGDEEDEEQVRPRLKQRHAETGQVDARKADDDVAVAENCFGLTKGADETCAASASAARIAELAKSELVRHPLSSPEAMRLRVRKSDAAALYNYLELDPVLGRLPLREAISRVDPRALALMLSRMGLRPVSKANGFPEQDFSDGRSSETRRPTETTPSPDSDEADARPAIPTRRRDETATEFGARYNEYKSKVAARLNHADRRAVSA